MERLGSVPRRAPRVAARDPAPLGNPPPASYLTCAYNSLHAYRFTTPAASSATSAIAGSPTPARRTSPRRTSSSLAHDYLQDDLRERLGQGPAGFTLTAAVAAEGDPTDDSTAAWPDDRERVTLGRLEVTGIATDRERDGDILVFDPTRVTEGIECSDDPILHFRPHAYDESVFRRTGVRRG